MYNILNKVIFSNPFNLNSQKSIYLIKRKRSYIQSKVYLKKKKKDMSYILSVMVAGGSINFEGDTLGGFNSYSTLRFSYL